MATRKRRAAGFTLVELLVVVTIIALLMSMAFPAFAQVSEAFRRMSCMNNQKQINTALEIHASLYASLPIGTSVCTGSVSKMAKVGALEGDDEAKCMGPNWLSCIQGNLGDGQLHENIMACTQFAGNVCDQCSQSGYFGNPGRSVPKILLCPTATTITPDDHFNGLGYKELAKGNYAACYGSEYYINRSTTGSGDDRRTPGQRAGMFGVVDIWGDKPRAGSTAWNQGIEMPEGDSEFRGKWKANAAFKRGVRPGSGDTQDSLARTILLSEVLGVESPDDGRGTWAWSGMGGAAFTAKTPPNANGLIDPDYYDNIPACDTEILMDNPLHCNKKTGANVWAAARSFHPGLVVTLFADGHSEYVTDVIEPDVWAAMSTRNGAKIESEVLDNQVN